MPVYGSVGVVSVDVGCWETEVRLCDIITLIDMKYHVILNIVAFLLSFCPNLVMSTCN